MKPEFQWTRFAETDGVIPDSAKVVALAQSSKCHEGKLDGKPRIEVFKRPSWGWSKVVGWELFWVVPEELEWMEQIGALRGNR